jgi:DNA-binding FadR family transcriptional regulator
MAFQPLRTPNLNEEIRKQVRDYILDNQLRPGDRLPTESALAEQLSVGRSAVREALKAMEALGIIEVRAGKGRFVKKADVKVVLEVFAYTILLDRSSIRELLRVRKALESSFVGESIACMSEQDLEEMRALLEIMKAKAVTGESFFEEDLEFHRTLFRPIGNQLLLELLDLFMMVYRRARGRLFPVSSSMQTVREHDAIFGAVEQGDVSRAQELIQKSFSGIEKRVDQAVGAPEVQPGR